MSDSEKVFIGIAVGIPLGYALQDGSPLLIIIAAVAMISSGVIARKVGDPA